MWAKVENIVPSRVSLLIKILKKYEGSSNKRKGVGPTSKKPTISSMYSASSCSLSIRLSDKTVSGKSILILFLKKRFGAEEKEESNQTKKHIVSYLLEIDYKIIS